MWLKAWHLIGMVTWFAGLFYLPRLFVYHAVCEDDAVHRDPLAGAHQEVVLHAHALDLDIFPAHHPA